MTTTDLEALHDRWYRPMLIYAARKTKSYEDAQEIVDDAFMKVWKTGDAARSLNGLLLAAVRTGVTDFYRVKNAKRRLEVFRLSELDENIPVEIPDLIESLVIDGIFEVSKALPGQCRRIFNLYCNGKTTDEIMEILGISQRNVLNQKQRAIGLIRSKLHLK